MNPRLYRIQLYELKSAIKHKQAKLVDYYLDRNPDLLLALDKNKKSLFHKALEMANTEIFTILLKHLEMLKTYDSNHHASWTALYNAATSGDFQEYQAIVKALGKKAEIIFWKPNLDGLLPIQLARANPKTDSKIMEDLENRLSHYQRLKELQADLDLKEILTANAPLIQKNKKLSLNLMYGYIAASSTRRIIKCSSTHPSINGLSSVAFNAQIKLCKKTRNSCKNQAPPQSTDPDIFFHQCLADKVTIIKQDHAGLCAEYSILTLNALLNMGMQTVAEPYGISNGDHGFAVLDRAEFSDPEDYRTWGPSAVVIDSWSGEVYPASQLPDKLKAYFCYKNMLGKLLNITVPFDKSVHKIAPVGTPQFSKEYWLSRTQPDSRDFNKEEMGLLEHAKRVRRFHFPSSNPSRFYQPLKTQLQQKQPAPKFLPPQGRLPPTLRPPSHSTE